MGFEVSNLHAIINCMGVIGESLTGNDGIQNTPNNFSSGDI